MPHASAEALRGARISDPALEAAYRAHQLPEERGTATILVAVGVVALAAFVASDLLLRLSTGTLGWLLVARAGIVVIGAAVLLAIRRARDAARLHRLTLSWSLAFVLFMLAMSATRPRGHLLHLPLDVLVVTAFWTLLPGPFWQQAVAGLAATGGATLTLLLFRDLPGPVAVMPIAFSLGLANVLGWMTTWRLHRARRLEFLEREALERALSEIRVIKGLLPICASCKSIRSDDGEWRQLEAYLSEHTEAEFTHGLCGACLQRLYPDQAPPAATPGPRGPPGGSRG